MTTYVVVIEVKGKPRTVSIRAVNRSSAIESTRMMYGGKFISADEVGG